METLKKLRILNGNTLKLLAAALMLVDHMGLLLFPNTLWLRMIGRLSMPLFAFTISEGCRYTKNKVKHFLLIFILGALCQAVYFVVDPSTVYLGILLTFSISILLIYAMQYAKKCLFDEKEQLWVKIGACTLFVCGVIATYFFCQSVRIDYGFFGAMLPVAASLFDFHRIPAPDVLKKLDVLPLRILCMAIPMIPLLWAGMTIDITIYSLCAIPVLFLYNGEKGKWKMKYFFYVFYPLHLALLEGVYILMLILK